MAVTNQSNGVPSAAPPLKSSGYEPANLTCAQGPTVVYNKTDSASLVFKKLEKAIRARASDSVAIHLSLSL